ncbi:hypothetical protein BCR32DRAFT_264328 [Anaeromyces robustus]|uniref:Uncharacterized protein n=1 Tax=Anaeromyces robustus TaxID=1754192 RepID=A0A1Y1XNS3_9FUNG|nr:hypothetical protein BCR32DRAFT_264328 [Anaeromyces robustus]|eukprot:ORX87407.1 hypothetical protein BCR32DRAFT_264328 [Anaeromyces robustus]
MCSSSLIVYKKMEKYDHETNNFNNKITEENMNPKVFIYLIDFMLLVLSPFYLYVFYNILIDIISCSITGVYATLQLKECILSNELNCAKEPRNHNYLLSKYLKLSLTKCFGPICLHPIYNIFILCVNILKLCGLLILPIIYIILSIFNCFTTKTTVTTTPYKIRFASEEDEDDGEELDRSLNKPIGDLIISCLHLKNPIFTNYLDIIIKGKSFFAAYNESEMETNNIEAPFSIRIIKYFGSIFSTFIVGSFVILLCKLYGKPTDSLIVYIVIIVEFFISLIYHHPVTCGTQVIRICCFKNGINETEECLNVDNDDN